MTHDTIAKIIEEEIQQDFKVIYGQDNIAYVNYDDDQIPVFNFNHDKLQKFTEDEVLFIIYHEIAHIKLKHLLLKYRVVRKLFRDKLNRNTEHDFVEELELYEEGIAFTLFHVFGILKRKRKSENIKTKCKVFLSIIDNLDELLVDFNPKIECEADQFAASKTSKETALSVILKLIQMKQNNVLNQDAIKQLEYRYKELLEMNKLIKK